ncbi:MAG: hypothetical protein A3F40_02600 [Chlamydiae bacterium RIFCSPHIGHO2_12_FULL_27_8]|nr:MAG: hypothetical protein A3F40_02600 [Chlamydiae bacterium RIFCSPHIGHO2_12_FULL_27_8]
MTITKVSNPREFHVHERVVKQDRSKFRDLKYFDEEPQFEILDLTSEIKNLFNAHFKEVKKLWEVTQMLIDFHTNLNNLIVSNDTDIDVKENIFKILDKINFITSSSIDIRNIEKIRNVFQDYETLLDKSISRYFFLNKERINETLKECFLIQNGELFHSESVEILKYYEHFNYNLDIENESIDLFTRYLSNLKKKKLNFLKPNSLRFRHLTNIKEERNPKPASWRKDFKYLIFSHEDPLELAIESVNSLEALIIEKEEIIHKLAHFLNIAIFFENHILEINATTSQIDLETYSSLKTNFLRDTNSLTFEDWITNTKHHLTSINKAITSARKRLEKSTDSLSEDCIKKSEFLYKKNIDHDNEIDFYQSKITFELLNIINSKLRDVQDEIFKRVKVKNTFEEVTGSSDEFVNVEDERDKGFKVI